MIVRNYRTVCLLSVHDEYDGSTSNIGQNSSSGRCISAVAHSNHANTLVLGLTTTLRVQLYVRFAVDSLGCFLCDR
jgi:hypothetical protein